MIGWFVVGYGILFAGCAMWREALHLKNNKIQIERICVIVATAFYLLMKANCFEKISFNIYQTEIVAAAMLGFIYMLYFSLLVRKMISDSLQTEDRNLRVKKRLLYKLPLVGFLGGLVLYQYAGKYFFYLLLVISIFFSGLVFKLCRQNIHNVSFLIFLLFTIIFFILKVITPDVVYIPIVWISDIVFSISVLAILEVFKNGSRQDV